MNNYLWICAFSVLCVSCKTGHTSDNQYLSVAPASEQAVVVPTPKYSCVDLADGEVSTTGLTTTPSVKAYSAVWNNLHLSWADSSRDLYIAYISVEFISPLFQGGKYSAVLSADEIDALFSLKGGKVLRATANPATSPPTVTPHTIDSAAKSDAATAGVADCGLSVGSINLVNEVRGTARGLLKIAGTAVDDRGNEEFIRESIAVSLLVAF